MAQNRRQDPDTGTARLPDPGNPALGDERRALIDHDTSSRDDQAFGRQAGRDADLVDDLVAEGEGDEVERLGTRKNVPKPGSKA